MDAGPALPGHSIGRPATLLELHAGPPSVSFYLPRCVLHCPRTSLSSVVVASKCASLPPSRRRQLTPHLARVQPAQPGEQWGGRPSQQRPKSAVQGEVVCLCLGCPTWPGCLCALLAHAFHSSVVRGPAAESAGPCPPAAGPARLAGMDAAPVGPARRGSKHQSTLGTAVCQGEGRWRILSPLRSA
eukprot:4083633-Amphidinium_carterae.2